MHSTLFIAYHFKVGFAFINLSDLEPLTCEINKMYCKAKFARYTYTSYKFYTYICVCMGTKIPSS